MKFGERRSLGGGGREYEEVSTEGSTHEIKSSCFAPLSPSLDPRKRRELPFFLNCRAWSELFMLEGCSEAASNRPSQLGL